MTAIEIARKFAQYKQTKDAQHAYLVFLQQDGEKNPKEELEAASYIFFSKGDYQAAYTVFISLYNRGLFQSELMELMTQAFYLPNVERLRKQYTENCRVLESYPYFFGKAFPDFDDLPILFFPFNDEGFVPFIRQENRFGKYVNFNDPVIDRWFFKDLEKPILAQDVYSQYQLEYLNDTVRRSEWVGRENHIYLHYTSWSTFCAYLQCLSLKALLKDEKFVFLIEEESSLYPIDFRERFGIDYSKYPVKPIGLREINRMIWHTQLAAHNGGDFFNEIFHGHPNLIAYESLMLDDLRTSISCLREKQKRGKLDTPINRELAQIKHPTEKDYLVAIFLEHFQLRQGLDHSARIAPALFFQPHFGNINYKLTADEKRNAAVLESKQYEEIRNSPVFRQFKYIKTFTPMRRITTSYGATVRFMLNGTKTAEKKASVSDVLSERLLNRSFMIDPQDRLYKDSVLVRFEDGKLNPKATFTALAEFLDIPYTESMTYCSGRTGLNPESLKGNDRGFDPAAIYRTYDEYVNDADRAILEYFLRDAYDLYGYSFQYYHGEPVDSEWVEQKLREMPNLDGIIKQTHADVVQHALQEQGVKEDQALENGRKEGENRVIFFRDNRKRITDLLLRGLHFINKNGQPLRMMEPLKLDPDLLEQPLYR